MKVIFHLKGATSYRSKADLEDKRRTGYIYTLFLGRGFFILPLFPYLSKYQEKRGAPLVSLRQA